MLASEIEMDSYSWSDTSQIAELRMQFAQPPTYSAQQCQSNSLRQTFPQGSVRICAPYQTDSCQSVGGHEGFNHACAYCFSNTGMLFNHRGKDCCRKTFKKKRAAGGQLIFLPHNIQSGIFYGLNLAELVGEYDHAGGD